MYSKTPTCKYMTEIVRDNDINAMPSTPDKHRVNSTIRCARYKNELANFFHAVLFTVVTSRRGPG